MIISDTYVDRLSFFLLQSKENGIAFATSIEPFQADNPCSLTKLYTVGRPANSQFNIPVRNNKNGRWTSSLRNSAGKGKETMVFQDY